MAEAVLLSVLEDLNKNVLSSLREEKPAVQRFESMINALDRFYDGGRSLCFLSVFVVGTGETKIKFTMQGALQQWLDLLQTCLKEGGVLRWRDLGFRS